MEKKRLFAMLTLIAGVMLVFALSGCKDPPPQGTWQETNIEITGTWSGDTISFTYNGSPGTITRNGGGASLDGVWNGTFQGDTVKVTVSGSNWTMEVLDNGKYVEYAKGTVTNSSGALTIIVTHVMDYGDEVYESVPGPGGGAIGPGTEVSTNGSLTITGLGTYNDQKVRAYCGNNNSALILEAVGMLQDTGESQLRYRYIASNITGDQATLKVYRQIGQSPNHTYSSYNGNDQNVTFTVWITNSNSDTLATGSATVSFTNGVGSGVFSQP